MRPCPPTPARQLGWLSRLLLPCLLLLPLQAWAQTVQIISPTTVLDSSSTKPSDKDGFPPSSSSADPEEATLVARLVVPAKLFNPQVQVLDDNADGIDDLRVDDQLGPEIGALIPTLTTSLDHLDGVMDGALSPGTYYVYWNLDKTEYDVNLPFTSASVTLKGDIERYSVKLTHTGGTVTSPVFPIKLESAASIDQNDLRWLETGPSTIQANLGASFTICTKYSHQSANALYRMILNSYYNGGALRLDRVDLYYYDTNGGDVGSVVDASTGLCKVPAGFHKAFTNFPILELADQPSTLTSGDRWVGEFRFTVIGQGGSRFVPYFETKPSSTSNWKIDTGYENFQVEPPGEINPAKLAIAKQFSSAFPGGVVSGPNPPMQGSETTFELAIQVQNTGFDEAKQVVVADAIPAGVTLDLGSGLTPSQGTATYDNATGQITWSVGSLAAADKSGDILVVNGVATLTFRVRLTPTAAQVGQAVLLNAGASTSGVSAQTGKTVTAGPTPPLKTQPVAPVQPVLALSKAVDKAQAAPGETLTYTLTWSNQTIGTATGVVIADPLPAKVSFLSATNGGSYDAATHTVLWSLGSVGALQGGSVSVTVALDTTFPAGATNVDDQARIFSDQTGLQTSNTVTTQVTAGPALTLAKAVDLGQAAPGSLLTYTLTLVNQGNAAATGVVVEDGMPAYTSLVTASAPGGLDTTKNAVIWNLGTIEPGATVTLTLQVQVAAVMPAGTTTIVNLAVVQSDQVPSQPSSQVATLVDAAPVLAITKAVSAAVAAPGTSLTYTLTYTNTGNAHAEGATISDPLPAQATFVSSSGGGSYDPASHTVSWAVGTLSAGASGSVAVTVLLDPVFPAGTTEVVNQATLAVTHLGTVPSNPVSTLVDAAPALGLTKVVDLDAAVPGQALTYTLQVQNTGNAPASGAQLVDALPALTTFLAASDGGSHDEATHQITWNLGTLAAGGTAVRTVTVQLAAVFPAGTTAVVNQATLTSTETAALQAQATTNVSAAPALSLTKAVSAGQAAPGGQIAYTLTLTNTGNADATEVVVRDALPQRTSLLSATGTGSLSNGEVVWSLGTVAAGSSVTLGMTVTLDAVFPAGTTQVDNVATVQSAETPAQPSNPVTTQVTAAPAIVTAKSVDLTDAQPGAVLTYTITASNTGNADAGGVVVTDVLDGKLAWLSASDSGTYEATTRTVSWTIGTLAAGSSVTVTVQAQLAAVFPAGTTQVANTAVTTADQLAPAGSPPVTTLVTAAPNLAISKEVDKASALPGQALTYTLTVSNGGNADASGVTVSDALPALTSLVSASNDGQLAGGVVTWALGTVAAGGSVSVQVTVQLAAVFPQGATQVSNTAIVQSNQTPPQPSQPAVTTVTAAPALTLGKTVTVLPASQDVVNTASLQANGVPVVTASATTASVATGTRLLYTLTLGNGGNADAAGAVLADVLPAGAVFEAASSGGTYDPASHKVTWNLGNVPAGTTGLQRTVTVRFGLVP